MRSRGAQFQRRAQEAVEDEALLPEALEELSTAHLVTDRVGVIREANRPAADPDRGA